MIKSVTGTHGADRFYYANEAALKSTEPREVKCKEIKEIKAHRLYSAQLGSIKKKVEQSRKDALDTKIPEARRKRFLLEGDDLEDFLYGAFTPEFREDIFASGSSLSTAFAEMVKMSGVNEDTSADYMGSAGFVKFLQQNLVFDETEQDEAILDETTIHLKIVALVKDLNVDVVPQLVKWAAENHFDKNGKIRDKPAA